MGRVFYVLNLHTENQIIKQSQKITGIIEFIPLSRDMLNVLEKQIHENAMVGTFNFYLLFENFTHVYSVS